MCFYDYKRLIEKCQSPFELFAYSRMLDDDSSVNDYDRKCISRLIQFRTEYLKTKVGV